MLALASAPAAAAPVILTFNTNEVACTPTDGAPATVACTTDGQLIGGNYGSTAELTVSYDSSESSGAATSLRYTSDRFYTANDGQAAPFSDGPTGEFSRIIFTPAAGYEVSFREFTWDKLTATSAADFIFQVRDAADAIVFSSGIGTQTIVANTAYSTGPLTFLFDNGGRGAVAVDDVTVDVRLAAPGAVPEPATWAMMIGGFGMVGGALRRKQKIKALLTA